MLSLTGGRPCSRGTSLNSTNAQGFTLVEMLVALVLAAMVFALATTSTLRQQQSHQRILGWAATERQSSAALAILAEQLGLLDRNAGDVGEANARDTALQIREEVGLSVNCGRARRSVTLVPATSGTQLTGMISDPRASDSLWWFNDSEWVGAEITSVLPVVAACAPPFPATGQTFRLDLTTTDSILPGSALRITRQVRYALYRSSDGSWQIGFREWNATSNSFSAPQPLAGPFLRTNQGLKTGFRFFDSTGAELNAGSTGLSPRSIARLRLTVLSLVANHRSGEDSVRTDSVDVALSHAAPG